MNRTGPDTEPFGTPQERLETCEMWSWTICTFIFIYSDPSILTYGVVQDSVLRPIIFIIYTTPASTVMLLFLVETLLMIPNFNNQAISVSESNTSQVNKTICRSLDIDDSQQNTVE